MIYRSRSVCGHYDMVPWDTKPLTLGATNHKITNTVTQTDTHRATKSLWHNLVLLRTKSGKEIERVSFHYAGIYGEWIDELGISRTYIVYNLIWYWYMWILKGSVTPILPMSFHPIEYKISKLYRLQNLCAMQVGRNGHIMSYVNRYIMVTSYVWLLLTFWNYYEIVIQLNLFSHITLGVLQSWPNPHSHNALFK